MPSVEETQTVLPPLPEPSKEVGKTSQTELESSGGKTAKKPAPIETINIDTSKEISATEDKNGNGHSASDYKTPLSPRESLSSPNATTPRSILNIFRSRKLSQVTEKSPESPKSATETRKSLDSTNSDKSALVRDSPVRAQEVLDVLVSSCLEMSQLTSKLKDTGSIGRKLEALKDHFSERKESLESLETHPYIQKCLWEFYRASSLLNSKIIKYKKPKLLFRDNMKKTLEKLLQNSHDAWQELLINVSLVIADQSKLSANEAYSSVKKWSLTRTIDQDEKAPESQNDSLIMQADRYLFGYGVIKSSEKAFEKYTEAANSGNADACSMLGSLYENGVGVSRDLKKAFEWYQKAASDGCVESFSNIGRLYETGQGVEKNYQLALEHYLKGAELQDPESLTNAGFMFEKGLGTDRDIVKAAGFYKTASDKHNYSRAQNALGALYYRGAPGIDKDPYEAFQLFKRAAEQGNSHALNNLGICYEEGSGVSKNLRLAKECYYQASDMYHASATNNLGYLHLIDRKYDDAARLFHLACSLGCTEAYFNLGNMYEAGVLHPKGASDDYMAFDYYLKAAKKSFRKAQIMVCEMLLSGKGCDVNEKEAFSWALKCAQESHSSEAFLMVAQFYEIGVGVDKDTGKAIEW